MTLRLRQALLTTGLVVPMVIAFALAPRFSADTRAQGPMRMLGPLNPPRVDANGSGLPDGGDESMGMTLAGNQLTVNSRWHCDPNSPDNVATFSNPDGTGHFQTVSRTTGALTQSLNVGTHTGTSASSLNFAQTGPLAGNSATGTATGVDINGDGVVDQLMVVGTGMSASLSFSYSPNNDYISIPWSQASSVGVNVGDSCGGADPQVWIPLADTNGDGLGDTIVLDLDGNGVADPGFFATPPLAVPAVPSMGVFARAILTIILGATAAWFLSRRRPLQTA